MYDSIKHTNQNKANTSILRSIYYTTNQNTHISQKSVNKFMVSGSMVRKVALGTNSHFDMTSGLRLQIGGEVFPGVELRGSITDENSPIPLEGATQNIQEIDKMYLELRSKSVFGVLGDFIYDEKKTVFGKVQKNVQGGQVKFNGFIQDFSGEISVTLAMSKGKSLSNEFNGTDGSQGPYYLAPKNKRIGGIIIGSEKIFVNNQLKIRGEASDYVIDYQLGEIYFKPKTVISSQSKIYIECQYYEQSYQKTFLGVGGKAAFRDSLVGVDLSYSVEIDNEHASRDFVLSDNTKELLSKVEKAFIDTSSFVGNNKGQYVAKINANGIKYFEYVGIGKGNSNPSFYFVGSNTGNYRRIAVGLYEYVGEMKGDYRLGREILAPQEAHIAALKISANPLSYFRISLEGGLSLLNKNKFMVNNGLVRRLGYDINLEFMPSQIVLFGIVIGDINVDYWQRYSEAEFNFFSPEKLPIGFLRNMNALSYNGELILPMYSEKLLRRISARYKLDSLFNFVYSFSELNAVHLLDSKRHQATFTLLGKENSYLINYSASVLNGINTYRNEYSDLIEHEINSRQMFVFVNNNDKINFSPHLKFHFFEKTTRDKSTDTLRHDSFKYLDYFIGMKLDNFFNHNFQLDLSYRKDYFPYKNKLVEASETKQVSALLSNNMKMGLAGDIQFTWIQRLSTLVYLETKSLSSETFVLRGKIWMELFKKSISLMFYYDASGEKTSFQEKQYIAVDSDLGEYVWKDINENRIKEQNEFFPKVYGEIGTDSLTYRLYFFPSVETFPVAKVQLKSILKISLFNLLGARQDWLNFISNTYFETSITLSEKSIDPEPMRIYLLDFSHFQNNTNTIFGNFTLRQVLHFYQRSQTNLLISYEHTKSITSLISARENRINHDVGLRFSTEIGSILGITCTAALFFQKSTIEKKEALSLFFSTGREFDIKGYSVSGAISTRISERFTGILECGYEYRENMQTSFNGFANLNYEVAKIKYEIQNLGTVSLELKRSYTGFVGQQPIYELIKGNFVGEALEWRIKADILFEKFIVISGSYYGKIRPNNETTHLVSLESRIVF